MMSRRAGIQGAEPHQWFSNTVPLAAMRSMLGVRAGDLEPYRFRKRRLVLSARIKIAFMVSVLSCCVAPGGVSDVLLL